MAQYIDKDALVAEIERKIHTEQGYSSGDAECGYRDCAREILSFIDTLEVKEIEDLQGIEKEVAKGKNIPILKKILLWFFESANANDEEFSKAIKDIENGLI